MRMKEPLQLRLDRSASPERVARATRVLADVLDAVVPPKALEKVTVVVSNFDMRATVRVRDLAAEKAVAAVVRFLEDPFETAKDLDDAGELAQPLAAYCREEGDLRPEVWSLGGKRPRRIRVLDRGFAEHLDVVARQRGPRRRRLPGATFIQSAILRVGRWDEGAQTKVRLKLPDGTLCDVAVDEALVESFHDAAKSQRTFRVKVAGEWAREPDGTLVLMRREARAVEIDEKVSLGTGRQLITLVTEEPVIRKDELHAVLRAVGRGSDDE